MRRGESVLSLEVRAPADLYEMVTAVGGASDDVAGGGSVLQRECFLSSGLEEEVKGGLFGTFKFSVLACKNVCE